VYDQQELDGTIYQDGGTHMNEPIKPLIDLGYKYIIVVALNKRKQDLLDFSLKDKARYIFIKPSNASGFSAISALNFRQSLLDKRKELGYKDAMEAFKMLLPENHEELRPRKRRRLIKRNIKRMIHFE
jgi:predicted acylesterase/phospholipase RssA